MTNADWWLRVRQQRDAVQPRQATDVELWRLTKGAHVAAAAVRGVADVGLALRLLKGEEIPAFHRVATSSATQEKPPQT